MKLSSRLRLELLHLDLHLYMPQVCNLFLPKATLISFNYLFQSSISAYTWTRSCMKVTSKICSCIGVSGSIGVIVSTFTIGQVIENFPLILMYQTFSTLALCFVILGIATILGKSLGRQIPLKKDHEAKN